MSLQRAIHEAMEARGARVPDLLDRMPQRDRSTIYRLLKGDTRDAKLSTILGICSALSVTPNELLSLAGLWCDAGRPPDPLDMRLRRICDVVQNLAAPHKLVAVTQVERLVETWQEAADLLLGRELEPTA